MNLEYLSKLNIKGYTDPEQKRCWMKELTQILETSEPFIDKYCESRDATFLSLDYKLSNLEPKYVFRVNKKKVKYTFDELKLQLGIKNKESF